MRWKTHLIAFLLLLVAAGGTARSSNRGSTVSLVLTDKLRHESAFSDADGWKHQTWWIHETRDRGFRLQTQAYVFYDDEEISEVDFTIGPFFEFQNQERTRKLKLAFPMGIRLSPDGGRGILSHLIAKVNGFGRIGPYPFFFINDLSLGLGENTNKCFLQYQFAYQPKGAKYGFGLQTDALLSGSNVVTWKIGPVLKILYHLSRSESHETKWTIDIVPFFDVRNNSYGIKFNFLTFQFRRQ